MVTCQTLTLGYTRIQARYTKQTNKKQENKWQTMQNHSRQSLTLGFLTYSETLVFCHLENCHALIIIMIILQGWMDENPELANRCQVF